MERPLASSRNIKLTEPLELRLIPDEGLRFDEPLDPKWIDEQLAEDRTHSGLTFERTGEAHVTLEVEPLGSMGTRPPINLNGKLLAPLLTWCVRCQSELRATVDAPIKLTLLASTGREDPGPEGADESTYFGDSLDTPGILRETLLLGLSTHPTCEDEPACDERTAALLALANGPAEKVTAVDPRWEALRHLVVTPDEEDR
jgi:hypothetical protein